MSKRLLFSLFGLLLALLANATNYDLGLTPSWGWSYSAADGTITYSGAYGAAVWNIPSDIDITDYTAVVAEFDEAPSIGVKIYTQYGEEDNYTYPEASISAGDATSVTLTLDTSWSSGITYIALQGLAEGEVTLKALYLVAADDDDDTTEEVVGTSDYCLDLTSGTSAWSTSFENNVITMTSEGAYGAWQYAIPSDVSLSDYASLKLTYSSEYPVKLYVRDSSWACLSEISTSGTGDDLILSLDIDASWASSVDAIMIQLNTGTEGATVTLTSLCLIAPEDDDDDEITPVSLNFSQPDAESTLYFLPVSEYEGYANSSTVAITISVDGSEVTSAGWGIGKMYAYNNWDGIFNSSAVPLADYQFTSTSGDEDNVFYYTIKDLKDAACVSSMYYTTDEEETYQGITINTWCGTSLKSIVVYPEANNSFIDNNHHLHLNTCLPDATWYDNTTTYSYDSDDSYLEAYLPKAWSSGLLWYTHNLDMRQYANLWIAFAEPTPVPLKVSILTTYGFNPEIIIPAGRYDYCFPIENFWFTDVVETQVQDEETGETTTQYTYDFTENSDWGTMMRLCLQSTVDASTFKIRDIYLTFTASPEYDTFQAKTLNYTDDTDDQNKHYLDASELADLDDDSLVRVFVYEQQGTKEDGSDYKKYNEIVGTLYKQGYDMENDYTLNGTSVWNNLNQQYQSYDHDGWSDRGYDFRVHLIRTADSTDESDLGILNHYDFTAKLLKSWIEYDYDSDTLTLEDTSSSESGSTLDTSARLKEEETDDDSSSEDDDTTSTLTGKLTLNLWKPWCTLQKIVAVTSDSAVDLDSLTGVESLATPTDDNATVEYYTLQGIRVDHPTAGNIYIRRTSTSATKIKF